MIETIHQWKPLSLSTVDHRQNIHYDKLPPSESSININIHIGKAPCKCDAKSKINVPATLHRVAVICVRLVDGVVGMSFGIYLHILWTRFIPRHTNPSHLLCGTFSHLIFHDLFTISRYVYVMSLMLLLLLFFFHSVPRFGWQSAERHRDSGDETRLIYEYLYTYA